MKVLIIEVKVQPGSKKDEVTALKDGVLHIKLRALAIDNKANVALIVFLSELLEVKKSSIELTKGLKGRNKCLSVPQEAYENFLKKLAL